MRPSHVLVVVTLVVLATPAYAAGDVPAQFADLATSLVKFLQGIGITISAIGFIMAGIKYNTSPDQGAKDQAKNAFLGCVFIAGAVVIAQFVKGFFV